MVSCICYSGQGDLFAIVVIILAIYPTLIESIDSRNKVSVVEVGYIFSVFCSCEGDGRLCGYLNSVLSPFYEVKACGWSRRQRHFIAVPVGAIAADCATVGRVGGGGDGVGVWCEVGDIVTIGFDHEGVGGIGRDFHAVLGPVDEIVQGGGSGGEGDGLAVVVGACAADCATVGRVGGGGDGVAVWCEFDKKFSIFCDCECDGWFG